MKSPPSSDPVLLVVVVLFSVGLASVLAKVLLLDGYTWQNGLLDVGVEALPAAVLYVLFDRIVSRHEEVRRSREDALLRVKSGDPSGQAVASLVSNGRLVLGELRGAKLDGMNLRNDEFCDSTLVKCSLEGSSFREVSFVRVSLESCLARLVAFDTCTFSDVLFGSGTNLTGSIFSDCSFKGDESFLDDVDLSNVRFVRCSFVTHERQTNATYADCRFDGQ